MNEIFIAYRPLVNGEGERRVIQLYSNTSTFDPVKNWNIDDINVIRNDIFSIQGQGAYKEIVTGPHASEIAWAIGYDTNGIVTTSYFRKPVLILQVLDLDQDECHDLENSPIFYSFCKLLRLALGRDSGVYITSIETWHEEVIEIK